jgi:hypothetical protein
MTQPLSQRLEEHAKIAGAHAHWVRAQFGASDAGFWDDFTKDLEEASKLAKRVESAPIHEVEPDGCLDLYLGEDFANKHVALVTLEEP